MQNSELRSLMLELSSRKVAPDGVAKPAFAGIIFIFFFKLWNNAELICGGNLEADGEDVPAVHILT